MRHHLTALTTRRRRLPLLPLLALTLVLFTACRPMQPAAYAQPFTAQSELALLAEKDVLPRNINLKTFEPHRDANEFTCRMQAERLPPFSPAAQALHEEAMTLTSPALWPRQRNWPRAMQLWQQAAQQGHWKAALMWLQTARTGQGVNSEKGQFAVPAAQPEEVVSGMERLMQQGLGDAFYWMGQFHQSGYGVRFSVDRAWAFWELAADMGSPLAQTEIALAMPYVDRDQEKPGVAKWANRTLMTKLLECAHAQGHGHASYLLGKDFDQDAKSPRRQPRFPTPEAQYRYALQVLHDGVKFGSEKAAGYLSSSLRSGDPIALEGIDLVRADRYHELAKALYNNPDLRFPNLDRVIPLPPADLPHWDSKPDSLIKAAQGLRVTPRQPPTPNADAPNRARMPAGHTLFIPPDRRQWAERPILGYQDILGAPGMLTGLTLAPFEGYYQPYHFWATHPERRPAWSFTPGHEVWRMNAMVSKDYPPLHFREGEAMSLHHKAYTQERDDHFMNEGDHALVYWYYRGTAVRVVPLTDHLAKAGQVIAIAQATGTLCADGTACPTSGVWQPEVTNTEHPLAKIFNTTLAGESWRRQSFVTEGQNLPKFSDTLAPVLAEGEAAQLQVKWRLMAECELEFDPLA